MIISSSKKFIFVANLKTASTSIENVLGQYADVWLRDSQYGKHLSTLDIINLLDSFPFDFKNIKFFKFGVMREPISFLKSLYNAHQVDYLDNTSLSTKNMSKDQFLYKWCKENCDQVNMQKNMFINQDENIIVNYILKYENLHNDLNKNFKKLGIAVDIIPNFNVSPRTHEELHFDKSDIRSLQDIYADDYYIYHNYTSKFLDN